MKKKGKNWNLQPINFPAILKFRLINLLPDMIKQFEREKIMNRPLRDFL